MLRRFRTSPNNILLSLLFLLTTAPPDDDDDIANLTRKLSAEQPIGAIILTAIAIAVALHNVTNDAGTKATLLLRGRCLEDIVPLDIVLCIILPVEGKSVSLARCRPYYSTRGRRFGFTMIATLDVLIGMSKSHVPWYGMHHVLSYYIVLYCINKVVLIDIV